MLRVSTRASLVLPSRRAPYVLRQLYHQPPLGFLHLCADRIAQLGAGKATLGAERAAFEWDEADHFIDPAAQLGFVFEEIHLGRDQAEPNGRGEEHTSELQSHRYISHAA